MTINRISKHIFDIFYRDKRTVLFNIAVSMVHDEEIAKDIVNETFIAVWEKHSEISPSEMVSYACGIIRNKCLMYQRSVFRRTSAMSRISENAAVAYEHYMSAIENWTPEGVYFREIMAIVNGVLDSLPENTRLVFVRKKIDGKSYREISEETGLSVSQIDYRMRTAMSAVALALEDYYRNR